jgi:hypothetical protein
MLLGHLSQRHPTEVGAFLDQMHPTEAIAQVAAHVFDHIEESGGQERNGRRSEGCGAVRREVRRKNPMLLDHV